MTAKLCSWWQKIRKPLGVVIITSLVVLVALIVLIILGYFFHWDWTGLGRKTLWDWLQLLIVPIVLAVGGFWLNQIQKSREERTTEQRAEIERELASDKQREDALQGYFDRMSELLFEKQLHQSKSNDEVRTMARARTLTVLRTLDANRKGQLLQFLYETYLINVDVGDGIIDLSKADLTGANLVEADLRYAILYDVDLGGANLDGANLIGAIFFNAYLRGANLNNTDLTGADLTGADLTGANLGDANLEAAKLFGATITPEQLAKAKSLQGATMPNGSKHP